MAPPAASFRALFFSRASLMPRLLCFLLALQLRRDFPERETERERERERERESSPALKQSTIRSITQPAQASLPCALPACLLAQKRVVLCQLPRQQAGSLRLGREPRSLLRYCFQKRSWLFSGRLAPKGCSTACASFQMDHQQSLGRTPQISIRSLLGLIDSRPNLQP